MFKRSIYIYIYIYKVTLRVHQKYDLPAPLDQRHDNAIGDRDTAAIFSILITAGLSALKHVKIGMPSAAAARSSKLGSFVETWRHGPMAALLVSW